MVIAHNMAAANTQRQYKINTGTRAKNTERLSSGYKINRAADNAAGLTISEKMRSQIRGLTQASANSQDGISFVQIADGALAEVQEMLDRMTELTVKAANGTNTDSDRDAIQEEIVQLTSEIDRVHNSTEFNTLNIFTEDGHAPGENVSDVTPSIKLAPNGFSIGNIDVTFNFVGADGTTASGTVSSYGTETTPPYPQAFTDFVKNASKNAASNLSTLFPKLFAASSANIEIGLNADTTDGPGKVAASASLSRVSTGTATGMSYSMNIDKVDYDPASFDPSNPDSRDLAAVIAHEMTHLVMYDTLTSKMIGNNEFPQWLIEGMAQTASGDNGWMSGINPSSSDDTIKKYMSQIGTMPYGAGYLATMELGLEVARIKANNPTLAASNSTIASGLDEFLGDMVAQQKGTPPYSSPQPIDVDEAINRVTNGKYSTLADYYNKFKKADEDLLDGVKSIINARGVSGAGSLFDNLGKSESAVFDPSNYKTSSNNYAINPKYKTAQNQYGAGQLPAAPSSMAGPAGVYATDIILQVGAHAGQEIAVMRFNMTADSIFDYEAVDCSTQDLAKTSMQTVLDAKERVSNVRSYYGAIQNRLEHTVKNLDNVVENTQAAESQIRDTDMAKEMVEYTKNNILIQAGEAMMTQANQSTQGILSLLQ